MNNAVFNIVVHVLGLVGSTYVDIYPEEKLLFIKKSICCICVHMLMCVQIHMWTERTSSGVTSQAKLAIWGWVFVLFCFLVFWFFVTGCHTALVLA